MSRFVLFGCAAILLGANPRGSPADVAAGAATFRSHCAPCHGFTAEGGRGPNLTTGIFYHGSSDADLLANISDGIAGTEMPGLFYSEDRVWQVVSYIRSLSARSHTASNGNPEAGQSVFRGKGCAQCHRVAGEGGRVGPDLTNIGQMRSPEHLRQAVLDPNADVRPRYWVVTLTTKDGRDYTGFLMNEDTYTVQFMDLKEQLQSMQKSDLAAYRIDKTSKMPSYRDSLGARELSDLVAYLSSLRPAPLRADAGSSR